MIDGIHAGKTLEQLKRDIKLDKYSRLDNYDEWLALDFEGVSRRPAVVCSSSATLSYTILR